MEKIGKVLHDRRIELNKTIEEVSKDSKITVDKLKAIEEGNLAYFHGDFSYLKFYVRFYCNYLGIDYEKYKNEFFDSLDEYSNTEIIKNIEFNQNINDSINRNLNAKLKKQGSKGKRARIDYSLLTFIIVSVFIVGVCIFGIYKFIINGDHEQNNIVPDNGIVDNQENVDDENKDNEIIIDGEDVDNEDDNSEHKTELIIEMQSFKDYLIKGFKDDEDVCININFNHDTWSNFMINGVSTNNPAGGIYHPNDKIELKVKPQKDMIISINLGYYDTNEIYINDKLLVLHDNVKNLTSGQTINLIFKGE